MAEVIDFSKHREYSKAQCYQHVQAYDHNDSRTGRG